MSAVFHVAHVMLGVWLGGVIFTTAMISLALKTMKWSEAEDERHQGGAVDRGKAERQESHWRPPAWKTRHAIRTRSTNATAADPASRTCASRARPVPLQRATHRRRPAHNPGYDDEQPPS